MRRTSTQYLLVVNLITYDWSQYAGCVTNVPASIGARDQFYAKLSAAASGPPFHLEHTNWVIGLTPHFLPIYRSLHDFPIMDEQPVSFYRKFNGTEWYPIDVDDGSSHQPHDVEFWHYCKDHDDGLPDLASVAPTTSADAAGESFPLSI